MTFIIIVKIYFKCIKRIRFIFRVPKIITRLPVLFFMNPGGLRSNFMLFSKILILCIKCYVGEFIRRSAIFAIWKNFGNNAICTDRNPVFSPLFLHGDSPIGSKIINNHISICPYTKRVKYAVFRSVIQSSFKIEQIIPECIKADSPYLLIQGTVDDCACRGRWSDVRTFRRETPYRSAVKDILYCWAIIESYTVDEILSVYCGTIRITHICHIQQKSIFNTIKCTLYKGTHFADDSTPIKYTCFLGDVQNIIP